MKHLRPQPDERRRAGGLGATLLAFLLIAGTAQAQGAGDSESQREPASELIGSDQTIAVSAAPADGEIQHRLGEILRATGRFAEPRVEVKDGVVFLGGRTTDPDGRVWATELATKTEGVVAVVNDITQVEEPVWSLQPALREAREIWRQLVRATPLMVIGLVLLGVTLLVGRLAARATGRSLRRRVSSDLVRNVSEKSVLVAVSLFGAYLFLRISGLTQFALTVAGGTGLIGLVIGFAFRDIAENFLASVLISVQRPFQIGDTVAVDGHKGIVQKVTARGTVLMDFDGNHIQIANATVYKNTIRNFTANPKMRINFVIGVGYESSVREAQQLALEVLRDHTAVLGDPEPVVLLEELGAATINLRIYFWIDGHKHSLGKVRSSLMRLILRAYEKAGISLPDEARERIFPQAVGVELRDAGGVPTKPSRPDVPHRAAMPDDEPYEVTEAEGDLRSEVADIQRQADASRDPEQSATATPSDPP